MSAVTVRKGTKEELLKLCDNDFTWETTGRFDVIMDGTVVRLTETAFETPMLRGSNKTYHDEIMKYATYVGQKDALMLVAFLEQQPVGYVSAFVEEWKGGLVINADGILVARDFRGRGIAKALLADLIKRATAMPTCRGIMIEMDTEKYEANKLLLSTGFQFAGARLFIYGNNPPKKGSKEALYFYYPVKE